MVEANRWYPYTPTDEREGCTDDPEAYWGRQASQLRPASSPARIGRLAELLLPQLNVKVSAHYRFDEGQRESIRRIISAAKSILSRNAISRAGEGLPSRTDSFRHAKIAAMTPRGSFAAFIHFIFHRGFSARICGKVREQQSTTSSPTYPKQLDRSRPTSRVVIICIGIRLGIDPTRNYL